MLQVTWDTSNFCEFVSFNHMLMGDWDVGKPGGIPHRQYVRGILNRDVHQNPNHLWRVYDTPGGVRAFLVSEQVNWSSAQNCYMEQLGIDPLYIQYTEKGMKWNCRVSPKPTRQGDYVARYSYTVGTASPDNTLMELVEQHDKLCSRRFEEKLLVEFLIQEKQVEESWDHGFYRSHRFTRTVVPEQRKLVMLPVNPHQTFLQEIKRTGNRDYVLIWADHLEEHGLMGEEELLFLRTKGDPWKIGMVERVPHAVERQVVGEYTDWSRMQLVNVPPLTHQQTRLFSAPLTPNDEIPF